MSSLFLKSSFLIGIPGCLECEDGVDCKGGAKPCPDDKCLEWSFGCNSCKCENGFLTEECTNIVCADAGTPSCLTCFKGYSWDAKAKKCTLDEPIFCTEDAKLCPDGVTYVGRDHENGCAWKPCPCPIEHCEVWNNGCNDCFCDDGVLTDLCTRRYCMMPDFPGLPEIITDTDIDMNVDIIDGGFAPGKHNDTF